MIRVLEKRSYIDWMNELVEVLEQDFNVKASQQSTSRTKKLLTKEGYDSLIIEVKDFKFIIKDHDSNIKEEFKDISEAQDYLEKHFK